MDRSVGRGIAYAVSAYTLWGILPLYWKLLIPVDPLHILAFRIFFSLFFVSLVLAGMKNAAWLTIWRERGSRRWILLAALAVSCNWGLYIWAVNTNRAIETSLGYFINPLISILLGLIFFRERLSFLQWVSFALAAAGVLIVTILTGAFPWVGLALALTFGFYGLLKKKISLAALEGLGAETLAASPLAAALLLFPPHRLGYLGELSPPLWLGIVFCGIVTALPLYFFAQGAKLLPLSALGFIQFIAPSFMFILGVFVFKEPFPLHNLAAFGCIWAAVILYSISLVKGRKEGAP